MDISINKKQLQETLRQMGIDSLPTTSKEELVETLKLANQHQWIKLASKNRVLRKKKEDGQPVCDVEKAVQASVVRRDPFRSPGPRPPARPVSYSHFAEEDAEQIDSKPDTEPPAAAKTVTVHPIEHIESVALQRAKGICELCSTPGIEGKSKLKPCVFSPLPAGAVVTIKDVAALCSECFNRVLSDRLPKDIKILKRQARRRRIADVKVIARPSGSSVPGGRRYR